MTYEEKLFLNTARDLDERIYSNDPYHIMKSTGLIRLLLLEAHPLVDRVNKAYKEEIKFQLQSPIKRPPVFTVYALTDQLDPDAPLLPGKVRQQVDRENFFKTEIIITNNESFSIKDVILFEAYVMGGHHFGVPKAERKELLNIAYMLLVGDDRITLRQVRAIGNNVIHALRSLRQRIEAKAVDS